MVPRELPPGCANGFRIDRIKDKLGTRALPTVELTFDGARAFALGPLESGLSNMVRIVLSTSRFWCALAAVGFIRGSERIARAYAGFRTAFGRPIGAFPLVRHTLEVSTRERRWLLAANFELLAVWDRVAQAEAAGQVAGAEYRLRARILLMMAKTVCTRRATARVHDAMMVLAGNGVEERFSALPRLWRDAAILETWEGPHGLLLARQWMELDRHCGTLGARETVALLLGAGASSPRIDSLSAGLQAIRDEPDELRTAVAFRDWADALYLELGAGAWRSMGGSENGPGGG